MLPCKHSSLPAPGSWPPASPTKEFEGLFEILWYTYIYIRLWPVKFLSLYIVSYLSNGKQEGCSHYSDILIVYSGKCSVCRVKNIHITISSMQCTVCTVYGVQCKVCTAYTVLPFMNYYCLVTTSQGVDMTHCTKL